MERIETVIIPMAGNGTRMKPATEAVPKELLPVYDTPVLNFALAEAVAAGARRIVLVTRNSKPGTFDYVHDVLSQPGAFLHGVEVVFAEQEEPLGIGHAVLCARDAALPGPIGVMLPDDLIMGEPCLAEMCAAFDPGRMKCMVAAQDVPRDKVKSYGIFDLVEPDTTARLAAARDLVEKPAPDQAPSSLAAVGRYVLSEEIWDILERTEPGAGDEIQLTDAIAALGGLHAFRFSGQRYDCGNKEGWFAATEAYRYTCLNSQKPMAAE